MLRVTESLVIAGNGFCNTLHSPGTAIIAQRNAPPAICWARVAYVEVDAAVYSISNLLLNIGIVSIATTLTIHYLHALTCGLMTIFLSALIHPRASPKQIIRPDKNKEFGQWPHQVRHGARCLQKGGRTDTQVVAVPDSLRTAKHPY